MACGCSHDGPTIGLALDPHAILTRAEESIIGALAVALLDDDEDEEGNHRDYIDLYRAAIVKLALSMEICPMHHCSYRICADEGVTECGGFR